MIFVLEDYPVLELSEVGVARSIKCSCTIRFECHRSQESGERLAPHFKLSQPRACKVYKYSHLSSQGRMIIFDVGHKASVKLEAAPYDHIRCSGK